MTGAAPARLADTDVNAINAGLLLAAALAASMEGLSFAGPKGTVYIRPDDHMAVQDMYIVTLLEAESADTVAYRLWDTYRPVPPVAQ